MSEHRTIARVTSPTGASLWVTDAGEVFNRLRPTCQEGYNVLSKYGTKWRVARMVLDAWVGPAPSKEHEADHLDGNRGNDHVGNLRWALPDEQAATKRRLGTTAVGEDVGTAKLTQTQVDHLRYVKGTAPFITNEQLAALVGVSTEAICQALNRRTWAAGATQRRENGEEHQQGLFGEEDAA